MSTRTLLCLFALWAVWIASSASATSSGEPATYPLSIASQPLESALQDFARQSGIQVIFFSQIAEGHQASALNGRYTLRSALETLLASSNLGYHLVNSNTVEIQVRAATKATPRTSANAVAGERTLTRGAGNRSLELDEVVVSATVKGLVATRVETPLREIPQTISIISREQIQQQSDATLAEALDHAVGITGVQTNSLDMQFYARGFKISSLHLDGSAALNVSNFISRPLFATPDLSEFDHIEVLRGADALFGADADPGATINLVRKRPLDTPQFSMTAWRGSWRNSRLEADVTGPIGTDATLRGRLVGAYNDRDYFYDTASKKTTKIFGVVEYDLTAETLVTIGGSYQQDDAVPFTGGLGLYLDGTKPGYPRHIALVPGWSRYDTTQREAYLQLEHEFTPGWKMRVNATSLDVTAKFGYGTLISPIEPGTEHLRYPASARWSTHPNTQKQLAMDAMLTGTFELFGRRAEVAAGGDFGRVDVDASEQLSGRFGPVLDSVFAFDQALFPDPRAAQPYVLVNALRQKFEVTGAFATVRLSPIDRLIVVTGARITSGSYHLATDFTLDDVSLSADSHRFKDSDVITPYAGLIYELNRNYSLYASYADIYSSAHGAKLAEGFTMRPARGVVVESGVKAAWREGALNGVLALYRIHQSGLAENDPAAAVTGDPGCCFFPGATNRSKGVDVELSGALAPGWLIGAGYTYNMNRDDSGAPLSQDTPKHLARLWTSATLPGELARWTVGGGLQAQSLTRNSGIYCARVAPFGGCFDPLQSFAIEQPSYITVDVRGGYQLGQNWRAALTVENVFDKRYYKTIFTPILSNWFGEPRRVLFRLDGRY